MWVEISNICRCLTGQGSKSGEKDLVVVPNFTVNVMR